MDRQRVLQQFAQKNGLTSSDAAEILIESGWDIGRADQLFHQLHKAGQINSFKPTNRTSHAFPNYTIHDRVPGHWGNPAGGGQAGKPVERIIPIHVDGRPNPVTPANRPLSDISSLRSVGDNKPKVSEFSRTNPQGNYSQPLKTQVPIRHEGVPIRLEGVPIKQGGVTVKQEGPVAKFPVSQFSRTVGSNPSAIPPAQREQNFSNDIKQKDPIRTTVSVSSAGTVSGDKVDGSSHSLNSAGSATTKPSGQSSPRPLKRGISKIVENESLVSAARSDLLHDIEEDHHDNIYTQTFILPDLTIYSADYRAFLEKDLIETSTLVSLEQAGRLNWWAEMGICQRLLPMATTGDGNCLLHAASLAMLGIHDRQLMLRKALFDTLTNKSYRMALYRRWRFQQTLVNQQSGLILSEDEWQTDWNGILKLASTTPRSLPGITNRRSSGCCDSPVTQSDKNSSPVVYESLEEFHVFVLAHVLQRVIIVVADTILKDCSGEALAPIPFGGIYLPLEINPRNCYRSPLLLTYDAAHFSALVPMDVKPFIDDRISLPVAIPVVGPDLIFLPLHFDVDPGVNYDWTLNKSGPQVQTNSTVDAKLNLLKKYLDMEKLLITGLDSDNDSDIDRKSSGSYESDDNVACISKDKKKEGKVTQQIQNMSKQFGSLGKSMGKKIKKNFGSVGKALKAMGPDNGKSRRSSIGSGLTQSTKLPLTIAAIAEQEQNYVWCAKIITKKADTQVKMIDNYLQDTKHRFEEDRAIWKAQGEEIRRRSVENFGDFKNVPCVTTGCKMYGKPETSYLCSKCFSEQKQQLLQKQNSLGKYETYPGRGYRCPDDVQTYGKSKFYVGNEDSDDQYLSSIPASKPVPVQHLVTSSQSDRNILQSSDPQTRNRAHSFGTRNRTPSPDYDNVEYTKNNLPAFPKDANKEGSMPPPNTIPAGSTTTPLICRNPGCDFYGSASTDNLCSACYKSKQRQSSESQQKTRL